MKTSRAQLGRATAWWMLALAAIVALGYATRQVYLATPYQIDIDVYRMGAQAWLDGRPLYGSALFDTGVKETPLPFTYPPTAAMMFTPLTWVSLPAATAALTVTSAVLLVVSVGIVLSALGVCAGARPGGGPAWWRRGVLATAIVAAAIWADLEPILANFGYGQINVVLMTLVIADCLLERPPWPRGLLLGLAIAVKLTPAVFVLYLVLRRDRRAALTALATFAGAALTGFVLAPRPSAEYWSTTIFHTNRIGDAAMNTNQNFAGALARAGFFGGWSFTLWVLACLATLALTLWAVRRALRADQATLALMGVALFGLLVSPVSWSHHWVWALPTVVTLAVLGYRRRHPALLGSAAAGLVLLYWAPLGVPVIGAPYLWWALAVLAVTGAASGMRDAEPHRRPRSATADVLVAAPAQ